MNERSDWVDVAKALGIILVVYGHVARGLMSAHPEGGNTVLAAADAVIYSFHMPLFFLLSGLFFPGSLAHRGRAGLVRNKAQTVLYPYVAWSIIQGMVELLMTSYTNGHVSLVEVLSFAWHPRAQFWFLYVLFFAFLLSALIYSIPIEFWRRHSHVAVLVLSAAVYLCRDALGLGRVAELLAANFVFFAAGVALNEYLTKVFRYRLTLLAVAAVSFVALQAYYILGLDGRAGHGFELLLALVSMAFVLSLSMSMAPVSPRWLLLVGSSSMTIYLLHILVGSGTRIFLSRFLGVHSLGIQLAAGTLCGVFISLALGKVLRRYGLGFLFAPPVRRAASSQGPGGDVEAGEVESGVGVTP